jgi:hypothetical protein
MSFFPKREGESSGVHVLHFACMFVGFCILRLFSFSLASPILDCYFHFIWPLGSDRSSCLFPFLFWPWSEIQMFLFCIPFVSGNRPPSHVFNGINDIAAFRRENPSWSWANICTEETMRLYLSVCVSLWVICHFLIKSRTGGQTPVLFLESHSLCLDFFICLVSVYRRYSQLFSMTSKAQKPSFSPRITEGQFTSYKGVTMSW